MNSVIKDEINDKIYTIRGKQVMLDRDLAELYGVETRVLNQAVKRNIERFPKEFCFQLNDYEFKLLNINDCNLISQIVTSKRGGIRKLPYVFTEQGIATLSGVLNSKRAIEINIKIMRAFVAMRNYLINNAQIFHRLDTVERKQIEYQIKSDDNFNKIFKAKYDVLI